MPWKKLTRLIEPFYPKAGSGGRPFPLEQMLSIYFLQLWYNMSDLLMEESLYAAVSVRAFAQVNIVEGKAPDETTSSTIRRLI